MQLSTKILTAAALSLILAACTPESVPTRPTGSELGGIRAYIYATTKTVGDGVNTDESGRLQFQNGDEIIITKMQRTDKPLSNYSYKDLHYVSQDGALDRTDTKGKIYWSDNGQGHTFVGYSLPTSYPESRWALVENSFYEGFMSYTTDSDKNIVDFSDPESFADEDVVLSYSEDVTPDASGYFAMLKFNHGLSRVKVVVNIKGFAATGYAVDTNTSVSDMILTDQNIKYRWTQQDATLIAPNSNIKADIKMWCENDDGRGSNDDKTFIFYCYAVPGVQTPSFDFVVTYPNATSPGQIVSHNYKATMPETVEFKAGYCTEIDIDLNHKNEKIIIGASFTDWEMAKSPDQGSLVKSNSFVSANNYPLIKLHGEVTDKYNASWLYTADDGQILDVEGHTGDTKDDAYHIASGLQIQSLAAEVGNGFTFKDKWIMLASDIYMQEKVTASNFDWPGIGDGTPEHTFDGILLGKGCYIHRLKGSPLFNTLGEHAVIERLRIQTLSNYSINNGVQTFEDNNLQGGTFAINNKGIITACEASGYVSGETSIMGLVQQNNGYILASYHNGATEASLFEGFYADPEDTTDPYVACFHFSSEIVFGVDLINASGLNDDIDNWNTLHGEEESDSYIWHINYTFADELGSHPYIP